MKLTCPLALVAAAACLTPPALGQTIAIDGSSTVYPITAAVAEEFKAAEGTDVSVGVSGTGGGFAKFSAGETDVSNASRPIKGKESNACSAAGIDYIEIPVAYDGLSIVTNKANTWAKELTVDHLRTIFLTDAQTWKDIDASFPATPIKLYTPGEASGTYDYFVEVVCGKKDKATGKHKYGEMRDDLSRSEDDNILVTGVAGDPGAIGFFGCAYYFENKDKINSVAIINSDGEAVKPAAEAIEDGSYNPFSRPLFIYVNAGSLDKPEVANFVDFYFSEGPELAEEVGYVRLPDAVYQAGERKVENRETGSVYLDDRGNKLSGSVTELYQ